MNDSASAARDILRSPLRNITPAEGTRPASEPDEACRPFANGRVGDRAQVTLICRKQNGSVRAFSYMHFFGIESDDVKEGFAIEFSQWRVTITGRNLEPLFRMICQHRVAEIRESDPSEVFAAGEKEPFVDRIDYRCEKPGGGPGRAK